MKKILFAAIPIIVIALISAYHFYPSEIQNQETISATIIITKNFGREVIQENALTIPVGSSVLDALEKVAEVEKSYGGGFVTSINNMKSDYPDEKSDWFYYVNGFFANKGASNYIITEGDSIRWDYHNWESQSQSAILADYPKHFIKGYAGKISPTVIIYDDEFFNEANKLKKQLNSQYGINATYIQTEEVSMTEKMRANLIILATPNNSIVSELNENHQKIGFIAFFEGDSIIEKDHKGSPCGQYSNACMIQITQNIWNPKGNLACENVILVISGTDMEIIRSSTDILIQDSLKFKNYFGLIITEQSTFALPACPTD
ncbi:hypothetical protein AC481_03980 [miscellaneous Crenarchaeota group archaeon SMTZ-80]|nr:MAG: hypothetical protein AC481_03980 [miscellaneous Crenarchaeota group archaeon SMTZ-80]